MSTSNDLYAIELTIYVSNDGDKARRKTVENLIDSYEAIRKALDGMSSMPGPIRDSLWDVYGEVQHALFKELGMTEPAPGQEWVLARRPWLRASDFEQD